MQTLNMQFSMKQYLKEKKDSLIMGWLFMAITGFGIFFLGAVPIVVMFGGFSNKSNSMWDSLASVGYTYLVGIVMYAILIGCFATKWLI